MLKHIKIQVGVILAALAFGHVSAFSQELSRMPVDSQIDTVKRAISEKKARWEAGETSLSKLSRDDQQARVGFGFELLDVPPLPDYPLRAMAPSSLDWREEGVVGRVKNQGQCGSCWAFALTAAMESYVMRAPGNRKVDLSEQVMLSCSGAGSCSGGRLNGSFLKTVGLPPTEYFPYSASDSSCDKAKEGWKQKAYRIGDWGSVSKNVESIKAALAQYGPLPTAFMVYEDFMHYKSGVYSYTTGKKMGGHGVLLVGYNDDEHYFVVKNSWGPDWGENGFFRIDYSEMNTDVSFGIMTIAYTSNPADNDFPVGKLKMRPVLSDDIGADSSLLKKVSF